MRDFGRCIGVFGKFLFGFNEYFYYLEYMLLNINLDFLYLDFIYVFYLEIFFYGGNVVG